MISLYSVNNTFLKKKGLCFVLSWNIVLCRDHFLCFWDILNLESWRVLFFSWICKALEPVDIIVTNQSQHTRQVTFNNVAAITRTLCMILFLSHVLCLLLVPGSRDKDAQRPCVQKVLESCLEQDGALGRVPKIAEKHRSTLTAHLQLTCHWPCGTKTRRQNYLWLRNISSKYRIKAYSECCHSCPRLPFTSLVV